MKYSQKKDDYWRKALAIPKENGYPCRCTGVWQGKAGGILPRSPTYPSSINRVHRLFSMRVIITGQPERDRDERAFEQGFPSHALSMTTSQL